VEWALIRRAQDGRTPLIMPGGGMTLLSRGFARNVMHALMLALDKPEASSGQIYNVCDDRPLYNREWVAILGEILDHEFDTVDLPFELLPKGFRAAPPVLLYPYHRVMDTRKLKEQLGYREIIPVEQGLEETVRWYLDHPRLAGGEEERNIRDPYDYEYEDRVIEIYRKQQQKISRALAELPAPEVTWRHPYPHPQKRGDLR